MLPVQTMHIEGRFRNTCKNTKKLHRNVEQQKYGAYEPPFDVILEYAFLFDRILLFLAPETCLFAAAFHNSSIA